MIPDLLYGNKSEVEGSWNSDQAFLLSLQLLIKLCTHFGLILNSLEFPCIYNLELEYV